jgi:hypothetical protein
MDSINPENYIAPADSIKTYRYAVYFENEWLCKETIQYAGIMNFAAKHPLDSYRVRVVFQPCGLLFVVLVLPVVSFLLQAVARSHLLW